MENIWVDTAILRKVVAKNVHLTTPKGNVGYDQYTVPNDCSCWTYFCCFLLALANIDSGPLMPFFQISLENRADKTTHNTFWDCRVHFSRQPFLKQRYTMKKPLTINLGCEQQSLPSTFLKAKPSLSLKNSVPLVNCLILNELLCSLEVISKKKPTTFQVRLFRATGSPSYMSLIKVT